MFHVFHINFFSDFQTLRGYCEEEMWVWLFPHYKCQKILSNHESKTSDLMSFWHEWCGKTNTHIFDLTVFTLLKTTITQIWHFFLKNLSNCCKVCTWILLSLCKACTWLIVENKWRICCGTICHVNWRSM